MTVNPKDNLSLATISDTTFKNTTRAKNSLNVVNRSREFPANLPGPEYKMELKWKNILILAVLHILCIANFFIDKKWQTKLFAFFQALLSSIGITVAAHRLFSHKSFKVNTALKLLLLYFQSMSYQNSAYDWARDHRVHHKYSDTNADPHNIRRGFFFSHIGWLLCKKHPDHRHFTIIKLVATVLIPFIIPCYFWNETFLASFLFVNIARYILTLHITWLINSAAHTYGMKPFNKNISPTDSYIIGIFTIGEGWHNHHHVFPYSYNSSDFRLTWLNVTTLFIDFFAWIGWAYDLKTVSTEMIRKRASRTGDGSHRSLWSSKLSKKDNNEIIKDYVLNKCIDDNGNVKHNNKEQIWGEEDEAMSEEDRLCIKILMNRGDYKF